MMEDSPPPENKPMKPLEKLEQRLLGDQEDGGCVRFLGLWLSPQYLVYMRHLL